MEKLGIFKIEHRGNQRIIYLLRDFDQLQPEEIKYLTANGLAPIPAPIPKSVELFTLADDGRLDVWDKDGLNEQYSRLAKDANHFDYNRDWHISCGPMNMRDAIQRFDNDIQTLLVIKALAVPERQNDVKTLLQAYRDERQMYEDKLVDIYRHGRPPKQP